MMYVCMYVQVDTEKTVELNVSLEGFNHCEVHMYVCTKYIALTVIPDD